MSSSTQRYFLYFDIDILLHSSFKPSILPNQNIYYVVLEKSVGELIDLDLMTWPSFLLNHVFVYNK